MEDDGKDVGVEAGIRERLIDGQLIPKVNSTQALSTAHNHIHNTVPHSRSDTELYFKHRRCSSNSDISE